MDQRTPTPTDQHVALAQRVLIHPRDFLGLVDERDQTVQFMVEKNDQILVDIPAPAKRGSYTQHIHRSDLAATIEVLPDDFSQLPLDGFDFEAW